MNADWKQDYLSAEQMRDLYVEAGPSAEESALLKKILEKAEIKAKAGENSFDYYVPLYDAPIKTYLKVCSLLSELGYKADHFCGRDNEGDFTSYVTIAW
jgi:hypothetical protein